MGYVASFSDDDFAEARAYIDAHHPELAGRLEVAPYREARIPIVCNGASYDLYPSPAPPGSSIRRAKDEPDFVLIATTCGSGSRYGSRRVVQCYLAEQEVER